jgi:hypothetical protein
MGAVARQGLPVFPALRDFESEFGGLRFSWRGHDVVLGVAAMQAVDSDLHAGPDASRVRIGRDGEWTDISMSLDGALWSHGPDDTPWELAASTASYIEHLALLAAIEDWCSDPFRIIVEPVGGELAGMLGLALDVWASDDTRSAWTDGACWLVQQLRGDPYHTSFAELRCRDIEAAADALVRMRLHRPGTRIQVAGAETGATDVFSRSGYATPDQVPPPDSWAREPGAISFAYLGGCLSYLGSPDDTGEIWLFGEPGARRFEQYVEPGADPGAGFVEWSSFSADRMVRRRFIPVYPPNPPEDPASPRTGTAR